MDECDQRLEYCRGVRHSLQTIVGTIGVLPTAHGCNAERKLQGRPNQHVPYSEGFQTMRWASGTES